MDRGFGWKNYKHKTQGMEKNVKYLFKVRNHQLRFDDEFLERWDLYLEVFDLLLCIETITILNQQELLPKSSVNGFMRRYYKPMTRRYSEHYYNTLEELGYVSVIKNKVAMTVVGKKVINEIFAKIYYYDKDRINPILRTLKSGKLNKYGQLIGKENFVTRSKWWEPYDGVRKLEGGGWGAYVVVDEKEKSLGVFKRAVIAAKARDAYISDNNLKLKKSIKL